MSGFSFFAAAGQRMDEGAAGDGAARKERCLEKRDDGEEDGR